MRQTEVSSEAKLTINIPLEMHRIIKAHAALNDSSIKDFVMGAIQLRIEEEDEVGYRLNEKTKAILRRSLAGKEKGKSFNTVEEVMASLSKPLRKKKKK